MKTKPSLFKRIISYFIDLLIIALLSGILSTVFVNTEISDFQTRRLLDLTTKMASESISREEYNTRIEEVNYDVTKESVPVTSITCIVTIIYYVVMCYYCKGITLGKYLMKLQIKSSNNKELTLGNYFVRSLIINMLLMNLVSVLLVSFLSKQSFIGIYSKINNVFTVLMLLSFIIMIYREDGRGLHDLISGTVVIDLRKEQEESSKTINDATVVEEQIDDKEKKKKVNKVIKKK